MAQDEPRQGGVLLTRTGADFAIWSHHAQMVELCLFDHAGEEEVARLPMVRSEGDMHRLHVEGVKEGTRYGYRAHGPYDPDNGHWFDPAKLLVDPYATELDRPFRHDDRLADFGVDTASLVPKAIVTRPHPATVMMPLLPPGGFIYELSVKAFTKLHPDVPEAQRGTIAALAHPSVIAHLKRIGVDAIELMPIIAWIDERHLPPLGLSNAWGYNPVAMMALDPRLAPGGVKELRETVAALHKEGISVILDLVFNHTGESDRHGATLSLRGLDNRSLYRHQPDHPGVLVNDTGTGNTLACDHFYIRRLILDSLHHLVMHAGIDGFRFDLAPVLGRTAYGFFGHAETLQAIITDDVLQDRILIAEPWDIGPHGYQLGNFPPPFLEWNDRARDTMRRFWRGDAQTTGDLATALAGSADIFSRHDSQSTRTVNFIAAHDGFTLMDIVSYSHKHNEANGEHNRDGHNENLSWNNGEEGSTSSKTVLASRKRDAMALLSTLFASRGAIMLTAGDEGGRSQRGNNNAYCQDNESVWLNWEALDEELVAHTASLSAMRKRFTVFSETTFFTGDGGDVEWLTHDGSPMSVSDWESPNAQGLIMLLKSFDQETGRDGRLAVLINRSSVTVEAHLPPARSGKWKRVTGARTENATRLKPRSIHLLVDA